MCLVEHEAVWIRGLITAKCDGNAEQAWLRLIRLPARVGPAGAAAHPAKRSDGLALADSSHAGAAWDPESTTPLQVVVHILLSFLPESSGLCLD